MRVVREAIDVERQIRVAVARKRVPIPRRQRERSYLPRRPERALTVASYATSMRHYAGC